MNYGLGPSIPDIYILSPGYIIDLFILFCVMSVLCSQIWQTMEQWVHKLPVIILCKETNTLSCI